MSSSAQRVRNKRQQKAWGLLLLLVAGPHAARAQANGAAAGAGPGQVGAGAGRRRSPFATNAANGPFTFDGFEFGFDGLNVNDPNLLTRALVTTAFNRLFNNPLVGFITQGVSNQARRPTDFLPWFLRNTVQRDVTQLRGYDLFDRYFAQVYALPTSSAGALRPAGCIGSIFALNVNGGNCTVSPTTGEVACSQPQLTLTISPLTCSGFWRQGCAFSGPVIRPVIQLSPLRGGYISGRPGVYDAGTAFNLTRVQAGFNINSRRILNDFGAERYYFYLVALLGFLLLRVARALIATPLPTLLQQASARVTGSRPVPLGGPISGGGVGAGPGGQGLGPGRFRNSSTACSGASCAQGGGAGLDGLMSGAVQSASARLQVDRRAMPGANALLQDPDQLIRSVAASLGNAGASGLADYLRGSLAPPAGAASPPGARGQSNRVTNQQLGQANYGTFDAQGNWNPGTPTAQGSASDVVHSLLWRRNSTNGNATSDDVLFDQIGQQMRRMLPQQAQVLDDALASSPVNGADNLATLLLGSTGNTGLLNELLQAQSTAPAGS